MSEHAGRILVVDDVRGNVRLLEAVLGAFDVVGIREHAGTLSPLQASQATTGASPERPRSVGSGLLAVDDCPALRPTRLSAPR